MVLNIAWLFVWHYFVFREIQLSIWNALQDVLGFALIAAMSMLIAWFFTKEIKNIYLLLFSKIVLAAVIYMVVVWVSGAKTVRECVQYLRKK